MKTKRWNMLTIIVIMAFLSCNNDDTTNETNGTDPVTEFSVTLNGEKFVYDDPREEGIEASTKAGESWVIPIGGKEEDGGPFQSEFLISFKDLSLTTGNKPVDGILLSIWKDNEGKKDDNVLYSAAPGTATFTITRIQEWKTTGSPDILESTYYILDGTFTAQMNPLPQGDPVTVDDAQFKNLVVIDLKTKQN